MHRWLWVMWTLPKSYYVLRITFGGTPPDTKKQVICLKAQADRFQIEEVPLIQPLRIIVPHYWIHGRPSTSAEFCLSIRRYLLYKHITGSKNVLTLAEVQRETAWSRVSSKDVEKKKKKRCFEMSLLLTNTYVSSDTPDRPCSIHKDHRSSKTPRINTHLTCVEESTKKCEGVFECVFERAVKIHSHCSTPASMHVHRWG